MAMAMVTVKEVRMWLDDIRHPARHGRLGWRWVRNYDDALALLATGQVIEASLDHDLTALRSAGVDDGSKTGYDVVCWMRDNDVWPRDGVDVHSANPVGADRMRQVIRAASLDEGTRMVGHAPGQMAPGI